MIGELLSTGVTTDRALDAGEKLDEKSFLRTGLALRRKGFELINRMGDHSDKSTKYTLEGLVRLNMGTLNLCLGCGINEKMFDCAFIKQENDGLLET